MGGINVTVSNETNPSQAGGGASLSLGDANAIRGDISVTDSHDVHIHLDSVKDKDIKQVLKTINSDKSDHDVVETDFIKKRIALFREHVLENSVPNLKKELKEIEGYAKIYLNDDNLQYYYHLVQAGLFPEEMVESSLEAENHYWKLYWSAIACLKLGKEKEMAGVYAELARNKSYPTNNRNLLEAILCVKSHRLEDARVLLKDYYSSRHTPELKAFANALSAPALPNTISIATQRDSLFYSSHLIEPLNWYNWAFKYEAITGIVNSLKEVSRTAINKTSTILECIESKTAPAKNHDVLVEEVQKIKRGQKDSLVAVERLASQNNYDAIEFLSNYYDSISGQEGKKAFYYTQSAAEKSGKGFLLYRLGRYCQLGIGTVLDTKRACHYFFLSALKNDCKESAKAKEALDSIHVDNFDETGNPSLSTDPLLISFSNKVKRVMPSDFSIIERNHLASWDFYLHFSIPIPPKGCHFSAKLFEENKKQWTEKQIMKDGKAFGSVESFSVYSLTVYQNDIKVLERHFFIKLEWRYLWDHHIAICSYNCSSENGTLEGEIRDREPLNRLEKTIFTILSAIGAGAIILARLLS